MAYPFALKTTTVRPDSGSRNSPSLATTEPSLKLYVPLVRVASVQYVYSIVYEIIVLLLIYYYNEHIFTIVVL